MRDDWLIHEKPEFLSVAINRHIASLRRPNGLDDAFPGIDSSPHYFPIYSICETSLQYRKVSDDRLPQYDDFEPRSAMPSFAEQPLACLTFTGALDDEITFLDPERRLATQISAFKAFDVYIDNTTTNSGAANLNGRKLEKICGLSVVLS